MTFLIGLLRKLFGWPARIPAKRVFARPNLP